VNINQIPIPVALASRPKDVRGLPIPFIQFIPKTFDTDGKVDFRITDPVKRLQCIKDNLCALCGQRLIGKVYFIGGPLSFQSKLYSDPAMHLGCAKFAIAVCPFLTTPNYNTTESKRTDVVKDALVVSERPEKMYLVRATGYKAATVTDGKTGEKHPMIYSMAVNPEIVKEF
jgi:hypothetical protein